MSEAQRIRDRAQDCRNLAKGCRFLCDREMLEDIAADFGLVGHKDIGHSAPPLPKQIIHN